jgi:hypothetical protein
MTSVIVRPPWSRRQVLTWVVAGGSGVGLLKLTLLKASDTTPNASSSAASDAPGASAPPTHTVTVVLRAYSARMARVLEVARTEAFGLSQPAFDQDDLLLGIATVPESAALEVLKRVGISQQELRAAAETAVGQNSGPSAVNVNQSSFQVRPSPRAQETLRLADDEARVLRHGYIGVEHLLLAILRQNDGSGYVALARLGVTLEGACAALHEYLSGMVIMGYDRNGDIIGFTFPPQPPQAAQP